MSNNRESVLPGAKSDRYLARQARSERIGEVIVALGLAALLAAGAGWLF